MMNKAISIIAAIAAITATPVYGQMQCAPHSVADEWAEQNRMAIASTGRSGDAEIQVIGDPQSGRFLIVARRDMGLTCILVVGEGFRQIAWGANT